MEFTEFMCLMVCDALFEKRDRALTADMLKEVLVNWKNITFGRVFIIGGEDIGDYNTVDDQSFVFKISGGDTYYFGNYPRQVVHHRATAINNHEILVTGGYISIINRNWGNHSDFKFSTAECYLFNAWFKQTGSMITARHGHALVTARDGRAFVFGGRCIHDGSGWPLDSIEIYNYTTSKWTQSEVSLPMTLEFLLAITLADGRILLSGGRDGSHPTCKCIIFDPGTMSLSRCRAMNVPRENHAGVLMPDGQVLVVGGENICGTEATCEMYDPVADTWIHHSSMKHARVGHACVLMPKYVMVMGGWNDSRKNQEKVEILMLNEDRWKVVNMKTVNRRGATVTVLPQRCGAPKPGIV
jgi:hypothetical protein